MQPKTERNHLLKDKVVFSEVGHVERGPGRPVERLVLYSPSATLRVLTGIIRFLGLILDILRGYEVD